SACCKARLVDSRTVALLDSHETTVDPSWTSGTRPFWFVGATSEDGALVAAGDFDGSAHIADAATGAVVTKLPSVHQGVQSMVFDHARARLAIGYGDGTVIVWSIPSGRALQTLAAHNGLVEALQFSPDDRVLATVGEDTIARLWDLRTEKTVLTLTGATRTLTDVAFSADGNLLATAGGDGTVRVYVLPVDQLLAVSPARPTPTRAKAQCRQYLPGGPRPRAP